MCVSLPRAWVVFICQLCAPMLTCLLFFFCRVTAGKSQFNDEDTIASLYVYD